MDPQRAAVRTALYALCVQEHVVEDVRECIVQATIDEVYAALHLLDTTPPGHTLALPPLLHAALVSLGYDKGVSPIAEWTGVNYRYTLDAYRRVHGGRRAPFRMWRPPVNRKLKFDF